VAFSVDSWIYIKKVIIQLTVYLDKCPDDYHVGRADVRVIWARRYNNLYILNPHSA